MLEEGRRVERPRHQLAEKTENSVEFEQARQDVLNFLNTPFHEVLKKFEKNAFDDPIFIIDELKIRLRRLLSVGPKKEAVDFVKNLVLNDKADDSQIPHIFKQNKEDFEQAIRSSAYGTAKDSNRLGRLDFEVDYQLNTYFSPDVIATYWNRQTSEDADTQRTYRTYLYAAAIEVLGDCGRDGEGKIIECLREIDSVVYVRMVENGHFVIHKGKLGKDISPKKYKEMKQKEQEDEKKVRFIYGESLADEAEVANINEDRFSFSDYELQREEGYRQNEYALTKETAFKALLAIEIGDATIGCLVESIKSAHEDFRENFYDILEILNKKPELSVKKLLKFIREEKDPVRKALATRAIYHLEFGRVGITAEGVKYLERTYDLGEYNNPDYRAERLTGEGEIGIFDEELQLIKYFHLGDLSTDEKKTRAQVLDFTYETLFAGRADETAKERGERMEYLKEFKKNYYQLARDRVFEETGVRLNNLSFKEQGWFLVYFSKADEAQKERIRKFLSLYREDGLKTFLALEQGMEMGEKILALAEKLPKEQMRVVLSLYGGLVEKSNRVEDALDGFIINKPQAAVDENMATYEILQRGKELLAWFADNVETKKLADLRKRLAEVNTELLVFASVFKVLFRGKKHADLSEVRGLDLQSSDSSQLSGEDVASMRQIFHDNRAELSPEFAAFRVKEEFDPVMKEPGHKFYMLKKDGQIISFARFDELPNGNLYTGFVNTRPDIKGMAIGGAFFEAALAREAAGRGVELKVRTENPAQKLYSRLGFKIIDRYIDPKSGKEYVRMSRPAAAELREEEQPAEELRKAA